MNGKFWKKEDINYGPAPMGMDFWHSSPAATDCKQIVFIEVIIEPGKCHSFHHHPNQEEVIYVVEGEIQQWIEKQSADLVSGESAFIPAGVVHASFNLSNKPVKLLAILSPAIGEKGYEVEDVFEQPEWMGVGPM